MLRQISAPHDPLSCPADGATVGAGVVAVGAWPWHTVRTWIAEMPEGVSGTARRLRREDINHLSIHLAGVNRLGLAESAFVESATRAQAEAPNRYCSHHVFHACKCGSLTLAIASTKFDSLEHIITTE